MSLPLTRNGVPLTPGAWMINSYIHFPVYSTIASFSLLGVNDVDDYWYVLPGYKLILWSNANFTSDAGKTSKTCDNTNGTHIVVYSVQGSYANTSDSCKLYYNNVEITSVYNTTVATPT